MQVVCYRCCNGGLISRQSRANGVDSFIGEIAALAAAFGFSLTSVCYALAGRKIKAVTSIAMSLPISWVMILGIHRFTLGEFFPAQATIDRWFYLGVSGVLAFVVSSFFMLNAYQHIGPRLAMLILSFAPVLSAILARIFLGQSLPLNSTIGITVVIFGIVWVVAERNPAKLDHLDVQRGVLYAGLGTLVQSASFIFASKGVADGFPPISATLLRLTAGIVVLWVLITLQRNVRSTVTIFNHDLRLLLLLAGAALSGPVISGSLVLLSFQFISVGVSTTLSHTTAIILVPVGYFLFKERITLRAIIGTIVTITGIAILFT